MEIKKLYKIYRDHPDISTDSRNIRPDCIFFALTGEKFDGSKFVGEALDKGARVAITSGYKGTADKRIIPVDDALDSLQQLAAFHRQECGFEIFALTGSNGKTTTKELCSVILGSRFKVFATKGNLNNHIGVPLTILSMSADTEIGIIEMGANHPGEIAMLCRIAHPGCGLITNIGKAHLEGFVTIQGVAKAKGELFSYLIGHGGTLFVNQGQKLIREQVPGDYPHQFAYNNKDLWAEVITADPLLQLRLFDSDRDYLLESQLTGAYNLENIVAAWVVGKHFGVPAEKIVLAISGYVPSNNRSQYIKTRFNEIILDAYNANPSSMEVAIENLAMRHHQAKLAVLGEMLELGEASAQEHKNIMEMLDKNSLGEVICVGSNFENPARERGLKWFPDVSSLKEFLIKNPVMGKLILVKGSRGNQLEKILELL